WRNKSRGYRARLHAAGGSAAPAGCAATATTAAAPAASSTGAGASPASASELVRAWLNAPGSRAPTPARAGEGGAEGDGRGRPRAPMAGAAPSTSQRLVPLPRYAGEDAEGASFSQPFPVNAAAPTPQSSWPGLTRQVERRTGARIAQCSS